MMTSLTQAKRDELRARYAVIDTSNVADVLDKMGHPDCGLAPELLPYPADAGRIAGWAYTIEGQIMAYAAAGDPEKMRVCQGLSPGEISVWSGDGEGVCYFGELIALGMKERGCVGAVVDGGVRDVRWLGEHKFPVYARYRTPVQSIGRWKVTAWQKPVDMRGATVAFVTVRPGDFILGDEDGVIAIPQALAEPVLVEAEKLTQKEIQIRAELKSGLTLAQALEKFGAV
jgi:regulator of RNase E activity RraA